MKRKTKPQTVNITPTWLGMLPMLTLFIKDKKPSLQKTGYDELAKMAQAADLWNEHVDSLNKGVSRGKQTRGSK